MVTTRFALVFLGRPVRVHGPPIGVRQEEAWGSGQSTPRAGRVEPGSVPDAVPGLGVVSERPSRRCLPELPTTGLEIKVSVWDSGTGRVCTSASANMQSAVLQPRVVDEYLEKEVRLGRVVGPLDVGSCPRVQVNRFGLVHKNHQPGKWRLIVDLSYPRGSSVNDGVEPELCSMRYTSVDVAVRKVLALGQGSLLAQFDVEGAYRTVPVHPEDRWLLGMRWRDHLYVDKVLPFGLRSAPKIYSAVADGLQWILREAGVDTIHYLDYFLIAGSPSSRQCKQSLEKSLALCMELGVPVPPPQN